MPHERLQFLKPSLDTGIAALLFALTLTIFLLCPVHEVTDSAYSMMASESLLRQHTFTLDHYALPRNPPKHWTDYTSDGELYTIELANGHMYYFFPPGNLVLSAPFVAVFNAFGMSAVNADGTYNRAGEVEIESVLAAILMAGLTAIFFYTSRLALPRGWTVVIALAGSLGTQILSTASRAMWTDTWGTLLLAIALWMILRREIREREMSPVILATLLAWLYFVRPTFSVHIIAITIYIFFWQRKYFVRYALTGAVWFGLFVFYSWHNFHRLLPTYYSASRLYFGFFWTALAANLVSPGRGLLVYVPILFFVGYLLVRYRRTLAYRRIVMMALCITVVHLAVMSSFGHWWGGYSFGPRFSTGLVPWFVVLAILGVQARNAGLIERASKVSALGRGLELLAGSVLLGVSIAINALGAADRNTALWNVRPTNIDLHPERNWDWRQPQFLAGLVHPRFPAVVPIAPDRIEFAKPETDPFLWYGWSTAEPEFRWSDGSEAALVFRIANRKDTSVTVRCVAAVSAENPRQRVAVSLNGTTRTNFEITDNAPHEYQVELPANLLKDQNVLTFTLPDAQSPQSLGIGEDSRKLGLAFYWMKFAAR